MKRLKRASLALMFSLTACAPAPGGTCSAAQGGTWVKETLAANLTPQAIWGSSAADLTLVGSRQSPARALVLRSTDGGVWTEQTLPSLDSMTQLVAASGNLSEELYAFGSKATVLHRSAAGNWTHEALSDPFGGDLVAGWVSASGTAFAVGDSGIFSRRDSGGWLKVASPDSTGLRGVWGSSDDNVYAVGDLGSIQHSTASGWVKESSGTSQRLMAVWGTSATDVYAVGGGGNGSAVGVLLHSRGDGVWTAQANGSSAALTALSGAGPADLYAAGASGTVLHSVGDGKWTVLPALGGNVLSLWAGAGKPYAVTATGVYHFDSCSP